MQALSGKEPPIESLKLRSIDNTDSSPDGYHIPRELIGEWATSDVDPFPDLEGLRKYAQQDRRVWDLLQSKVKPKDMPRIISQHQWPSADEITVEQMLKTHFDIVNLALEYTASRGKFVMIASGKCATAGNKENNITSIPDRSSFYVPTKFNEDGSPVFVFKELDHEGAQKIRNLLPGEIKIWYKFRREYLEVKGNEPGKRVGDYDLLKQAEMVFTQAYQYMNERNAAIGYIITDQELICIRRLCKERYGVKYGVMDISPSIPLSVEEGNLNAKLALFYIHFKYIMKEPHLGEMKRTPKPRNWGQLVRGIKHGRRVGQIEIREYSLRKPARESLLDLKDVREAWY